MFHVFQPTFRFLLQFFEDTKNDAKITFVFLFRFFFRFVTRMRMLEERGDVEEYLVSIIFRGEKK